MNTGTHTIYDMMTLPGFQVRTARRDESCTVCGKKMFDIWIVTPVPVWDEDGNVRIEADHWRMQKASGGITPLRRTACINKGCVQAAEMGTTSFPTEATKYMAAKRDVNRSLRAWHFQNPNRRKRRNARDKRRRR